MNSTKTLLKAATLAVLAATGLGISGASAQPYFDRHTDRAFNRYERMEHRAFVNHARIAQTLRFHGLRMAGEPMMFRGRMTVRAHDRFGRLVIVHLDRRGDLVRINRL